MTTTTDNKQRKFEAEARRLIDDQRKQEEADKLRDTEAKLEKTYAADERKTAERAAREQAAREAEALAPEERELAQNVDATAEAHAQAILAHQRVFNRRGERLAEAGAPRAGASAWIQPGYEGALRRALVKVRCDSLFSWAANWAGRTVEPLTPNNTKE